MKGSSLRQTGQVELIVNLFTLSNEAMAKKRLGGDLGCCCPLVSASCRQGAAI